MSPAQHQIHHSADPTHADRNYGTVLSIWDWLGGSLHTTPKTPQELRFGLCEVSATSATSATRLLVAPFADAFAILRPRLRPIAISIICATLVSGCASKKIDRAALLSALGSNSLAVYRQFHEDASALVSATEAYAQAPDATTRANAQAAWLQAMTHWEQAEMLRFGPLGALESPGGLALRDEIYAWPLVTRCLIEQQIVAEGYQQVTALATDVRGLATLEYLLFFSDGNNQCAQSNPINADGTWAALGVAGLEQRKARYAHAVALDVAARSTALLAAWEPNGFLAQLQTAGRGSVLLSTQQMAFNAVAEALYYSDTELKDRKLAVPLGLKECPVAVCSTTPESEWAGAGKQHLRANLFGMRVLLEGSDAAAQGSTLGFDDYLEALGASAIAAQAREDLAEAVAAVDSLDDAPLAQILVDNSAKLQAVYERVKALTDFVKMEFTTTLEIKPPTRVEGDHD